MRLYAAVVPPRDAVAQLWDVVSSVQSLPERPALSGPAGRHLAGLSGRRLRRRQPAPVPTEPVKPPLDLLPVVQMHLPMVKFGSLALTDAGRLADNLERQAATWETPRLSLSGAAGEPEADRSVWVSLDGDVDALGALVRGVSDAARGLHLFVDRRMFRPQLRFGTVSPDASTAYVEELRAALEEFQSMWWWQSTLSLLIPSEINTDGPGYKHYRDVTLGPAVSH